MNIIFRDKKLKREHGSERALIRRHGKKRAKLIMKRLVSLFAAETLATFAPPYSGPARCHELKGDKKGIYSVDLDHPYRLLFRVANNPLPRLDDGGIDWESVTAIEILGVEDTHE